MKKLVTVLSLGAFLAVASAGCKKKDEAAPAPAPAPAEKKMDEAAKPTAAPAAPSGEAKPAEGAAAAPAAAGSTGIAACDEYVAAMDKLSKCDKVPAEAAKGMQAGLEAAKTQWAALAAAPADQQATMKTAAEGACKTAAEGVKTALTGAGCQ